MDFSQKDFMLLWNIPTSLPSGVNTQQEDREVEKSERTENFNHFPVAAIEALGFVLLSHFTQAHKLDAKELLSNPKLIPVFAGH